AARSREARAPERLGHAVAVRTGPSRAGARRGAAGHRRARRSADSASRQAMSDPAPTPPGGEALERRLSFAFAKRHGVLVNRVVDGVAECTYRDTATPQALAEVRRYLRRSLRLRSEERRVGKEGRSRGG